MKSSPENALARQLSCRFVFLPVFLTFALSLLLMACSGANAGTPSSPAGNTAAPTEKSTLSPAPAAINFGTVQLNAIAFTKVVNLTNEGASPKTIESAAISPASTFSVQGWNGPVTLKPGQTFQLRTVFAPKSPGSYSAVLTLITLGPSLVESLSPGSPGVDAPISSLPRPEYVTISVTGTAIAENSPPPVVGVSVSPSSAALQSHQTEQFVSTVTGTSNTGVTWTAVLGSITSSGFYTAPTVTTQTNDTVSAVSVADPTSYASVAVSVTTTSSTGAAYSQNANSVTTKPLPSDVLSHCLGDTSNCSAGDAIAQCAMTDCGGLSELGSPSYMGAFVKASPGGSDLTDAFYNSAATDPWYSITAATPTGLQSVTFHAPNGARFPEGNECQITIWDQTTGYAVGIYAFSCTGGVTLPPASSCGGTSATACSISSFAYKSVASNLFTSQDYGYTSQAQSSGQFAPAAGMVREQELQNGAINHALLFTFDCVNSVTKFVFPGVAASLGVCGSGPFGPQDANRPSANNLIFCDYTPAQIASFNLPAWQATILTAFCTYGGYPDITQGANTGLAIVADEELESSESWKYYGLGASPYYGDPFWTWILGQKGLNGNINNGQTGCSTGGSAPNSPTRCIGAFLANIPRAIGPEGSDAEGNSCTAGSGCYPSGHIHVADSCIAKGFANLPGGCT